MSAPMKLLSPMPKKTPLLVKSKSRARYGQAEDCDRTHVPEDIAQGDSQAPESYYAQRHALFRMSGGAERSVHDYKDAVEERDGDKEVLEDDFALRYDLRVVEEHLENIGTRKTPMISTARLAIVKLTSIVLSAIRLALS